MADFFAENAIKFHSGDPCKQEVLDPHVDLATHTSPQQFCDKSLFPDLVKCILEIEEDCQNLLFLLECIFDVLSEVGKLVLCASEHPVTCLCWR